MSDTRYRIIFAALGLGFVAVVVGAVLFGSPGGPGEALPATIEQISPPSGSQVPVQTAIEVDVPVGYHVDIFVDGFRIPENEVRFVEGTGVYSFNPHQSDTIAWDSGSHTVRVVWSRLGGLPDVGEYQWSFRVF